MMLTSTTRLQLLVVMILWVSDPFPVVAARVEVETRSEAEVRALEAAILLSGQEGGEIRLAVWDGQFASRQDGAWVVLWIEIEGKTLLVDASGSDLGVDLYLYALDPVGQVGFADSKSLRIDLTRHREILENGGLKVPWLLELPAGEHLLRLLVRTGEQTFGIRSLPITMQTSENPAVHTAPPTFLEEAQEAWLLAVPGDEAAAKPPAWLPFVPGRDEAEPAALPVLRRTLSPKVSVFIQDSAVAATAPAMILRPSLTESALRLPLTVLGRLSSSVPQLDIVEFELPAIDLPSGIYTAVIQLDPGSPEPVTTRSFNLVVAGAEDPVLWPLLDLALETPRPEGAVAQSVPRAPLPSLEPRPSLAEEAMIHAYRSVLTDLAAGREDRAFSRLWTLEVDVLRGPDGTGLERLEESQFRVASSLADQGADLFPMMALHARSIESYRDRGDNILARHSLRAVRRLVELSTRRGGRLDSRSDIAALLVDIAIGEAEFQNLVQAIQLFNEALNVAEKHSQALLGLASVYERQGHYAEASAILDRLWRRGISFQGETELRLGINLARQSQAKRTRRLLSQLVDQATAPWIGRLAFQELAKLEMDRRPQEAMAILRRGLERWPDDFNITVQLAYCLDSVGRPQEALSLLRPLDASAAEHRGHSPRWFYHRPPGWSRTERWTEVTRRARQGLPELGSALERSDPKIARR